MNIEFQRMWEEAIMCIVSVELDDMTKDCGLLVKVLGGGVFETSGCWPTAAH